MHVVPLVKNLTEPEKVTFGECLEKKTTKLEQRLAAHFDEDTVKLNVSVEKFVKNSAFKVEMTLELPKAAKMPLHASEDSRDLRKAMELAGDKLFTQVNAAIEKMNHEHQRAT